MKKKALAVGAAGISLLALAATITPAHADVNTASDNALVMTGSDTTQDLMEGMATAINAVHPDTLSNYQADPVNRLVSTRTANANCKNFTVPRSSGDGRNALSAALRGVQYSGGSTTNGTTPVASGANFANCVNVARSSSGGNPTVSPGVGTMTYIPAAVDSVTFATLQTSDVTHNLNKGDLIAIYSANKPNCIFKPLLPALGSGTRTFFVQSLGLTDVAIGATGGPGTCVSDTINGVGIQEHNGTVLSNSQQLVPFSVAKWVAMSSGIIGDARGFATLGNIDFTDANGYGSNPAEMNTAFGFTRDVYNVVSTNAITAGNAAFSQKTVDTFVNGTSYVCTNPAVVKAYGFGVNANCGNTSKKNTN